MNEAPKAKRKIQLITPEQAKRLAAMSPEDRKQIVDVTAALLAKAFYRKMNSTDKPKPK